MIDIFELTGHPHLGQILAYLNPADLAHLRRVNEVFHTFLSGSGAERCWTIARANWEADNDELPDRPDDMTEIDFLVYLFGRYCHVCRNLPFGAIY